MYDVLIQRMRDEVTQLGATELRTAAEVDAFLPNTKEITLVVVNSICGCAAGAARPGLMKALRNSTKPDQIATVFAGQDREATARAREYFTDQPPSSPSFALFKDGSFVQMVHRHEIEGRSADEVATRLMQLFDAYCGNHTELSQ
ncbi:MAG: BrxA/BrxB family bacilliredoxin [Ignavibacteria bacterium]|nr:BrxA/BrxB family bacilliredoxin [Ignavibacteria bacterium]